MNQSECKFSVENGDSNDVLTSTVLHAANVTTVNTADDSGNELYMNHMGQMSTINGASNISHHQNGLSDDEELPHVLREQDRFLPIANVAKLMKKAIPDRGKIAKDAKECVQECVSEFISFITSEAAERCSQEKRKTINGEDLLFAMSQLGFDNYVEPLKIYLQKYRESVKCDTPGAAGVARMGSHYESNENDI
jgi:nuclear transcription Y subunit beta